MRGQEIPTTLPHERLDVYHQYLGVAGQCEELISRAPTTIVALDHLERAVESIGVNLIRANTQQPESSQRSSCLDVAIASTNECAASLDVCLARHVVDVKRQKAVLEKLWRVRGMLLGMKRANSNFVREACCEYKVPEFPFMRLDMYQVSLGGVGWMHDLFEELDIKARTLRKLDISSTGSVLNIAEGYGRSTPADQNRFMKAAEEHAFQTILILDLMVARNEVAASRIESGKIIQVRVISMLHAWRAKNGGT